MPITRVKVWIAGEVLTASDLNNEFNNIIDNVSIGTIVDGSLASPGIQFVNDGNTGIYRPGTDQLALVAGGATAFTVTRTSTGTAFALFSRGVTDSTRIYPALTFGGANDGIAAITAGTLDFVTAGVRAAQASAYTNATNYLVFTPGQTGTPAILETGGGDTNVPLLLRAKGTGYVQGPGGQSVGERLYPGIGVGGTDQGLLFLTTGTVDLVAGGRRVLQASAYTNATNYLRVTPRDTGAGPLIDVAGADTNIDLNLGAKGSGTIKAATAFIPAALVNNPPPQYALVRENTPAAWCVFNGVTASVYASYGVSSVVRNSVGNYTINWRRSFKYASGYAVFGMGNSDNAFVNNIYVITAGAAGPTATSCPIHSLDASTATIDARMITILAFGDQN